MPGAEGLSTRGGLVDLTGSQAIHPVSLPCSHRPRPDLPSLAKTERAMLPPHPTRRRLRRKHDVEAQSHGFDTYYLRFGRRVAAEPARLASGWLLAFTGRESNPLDRTERFRTIF